ncbi:trehalose-phosphatase [Corynebacterium sp. P5848]|uniref:trehalose-phosphatase n=1 Tax=Corynebacterium marambiense TaxID=2765364 RepID=UPI002260FA88|nr:trehalose-phosphatase [Corynebacterium marambiense]MCX7543131.1 trehalose-phosphatase [Corynebacterium marambiense]
MDNTSLDSRLDSVIQAPRLLVISDFDGTIADFADDPENVPVNRASIKALETLGEFPDTGAVILSGRDLATLRRLSGTRDSVELVGSHGAESTGVPVEPTAAQRQRLDAVGRRLNDLIAGHPGAAVESKPFHRVLHTRRVADRELGDRILREALELHPEGMHVSTGKCIVEFSAVSVNKGTWITGAKSRGNWDSIVFLGDDVTDEDGFRVLGDGDLGIKVGDGDTVAAGRVPDTDGVRIVLERLAAERAAHLTR